MADQKQCPKCGEKNPAEAVMCWACYTSLSGGSSALGAPAGGPAAASGKAPMTDSGEKKKIQPAHLAVVGVLLLVGAGFGASTMLGGGGSSEEDTFPVPPPKPNSSSSSSSSSSTASAPAQAVISLPPGPNPAQPTGHTPAAGPVYTIVSPPSPREQWATMAITPVSGTFKEIEAKAVAQFAKKQLDRSKKYPAVEIFVINDATAAQNFADYQNKHLQKPLTDNDYTNPQLVAVWTSTPVRYVSAGGKESYTFPAKNPTGFWKGKPGAS